MSSDGLPSTASPVPRRPRVLPILIVLIPVVAITAMYLWPDFDERWRVMLVMAIVPLAALALAGWTLFLSGYRWRTRLTLVGAPIVLLVGFLALVKFDGMDGSFLPRFAWSWSPSPDRELPAATPTFFRAVDLKSTTANDFPQFMGPDRDGSIEGPKLARDWSTPPKKVWSRPIGAGWSAFAVVGDFAVTQEQRDQEELVVCYEVATGEIAWSHADPVRFSEALGGDGPRATPTIHDGKVYALGATGILNCLDGDHGNVVWSRETFEQTKAKLPIWGKSSSPLVFEDKVVVSLGESADVPGGPTLAAYDRLTGDLLWTAGVDNASYVSPVLASLGGKPQIVMVNARSVTGHEPATGETLWTYPWPDEMAKSSQPVILDENHVFICSGYGVGAVLLEIGEGTKTPFSAKEVWSDSKLLRTRFTNVSTKDGYAYGLNDGELECVEMRTGKRAWRGNRKGRYKHGQVLLVDDLLIVQSEPGPVALVEATPEKFRELGRFPALDSKTWNHPVVTGKYLLVRNDREAACYELPLAGEVTER